MSPTKLYNHLNKPIEFRNLETGICMYAALNNLHISFYARGSQSALQIWMKPHKEPCEVVKRCYTLWNICKLRHGEAEWYAEGHTANSRKLFNSSIQWSPIHLLIYPSLSTIDSTPLSRNSAPTPVWTLRSTPFCTSHFLP